VGTTRKLATHGYTWSAKMKMPHPLRTFARWIRGGRRGHTHFNLAGGVTRRTPGVRPQLLEVENRITPTVTITPLTNSPSETVSAPYVAGLGTPMLLTNGDVLIQGGGIEPVNVDPSIDERVTNQFFLLTPGAGVFSPTREGW
jgi:hypothetical protein